MEKLFNLKCYPEKMGKEEREGGKERFDMHYEICKSFIIVRSCKILNVEKSCLLGLRPIPTYVIDFRDFSWLPCKFKPMLNPMFLRKHTLKFQTNCSLNKCLKHNSFLS